MKLEYLPNGSKDCPLIRLYDFNQAEVRLLRQCVRLLATGEREIVALHNEAWSEPVRGCCLTLRRSKRNDGIRQADMLRFECDLSSSGWDNVEGLLDPFCDANISGFQWLTCDGTISLLISQSGQW
jgi:hypothetical protein